MKDLTPTYRVVLNKNLLIYPQFMEFLKKEFQQEIDTEIKTRKIDLSQEYKFTIYSIPPQWGNELMNKIRANDMKDLDHRDKKLSRISEILHDLDPMNPKLVNVEFTLKEIVSCVNRSVGYYKKAVPGGWLDYFGLNEQTWFDDFPIQMGTVISAVDIGTLDNKSLHLFDSAIHSIRLRILDLFAEFVRTGNVQNREVILKNVDI